MKEPKSSGNDFVRSMKISNRYMDVFQCLNTKFLNSCEHKNWVTDTIV